MTRLIVLLLAFPIAAAAQTFDDSTLLMHSVSGTAANAGPANAIVFGNPAGWSGSLDGAAFVTHATTTGPKPVETLTFSTNWLSAAAQRTIGSRGVVLFRVRGSLEPWTMDHGTYPQLLQSVNRESGGPLLDRMRGQSAIQEAAVDAGIRLGTSSLLHVYAAPAGDPALGAVPYAQRTSSEDFAEAPFAYDVQESFHEATRVVTAGFTSTFAGIEGSVFHHSLPASPYSSLDDGAIDSHSARLTITPSRDVSLQYSVGSLGSADRSVSSASATIGRAGVSASALWTKRETDAGVDATALGLELQLRSERSTAMARVESVDKQDNRVIAPNLTKLTHVTFGHIFEAVRASGWRAGLGANIDYHTKFREFDTRYGHKPQMVYLFVRVRTDGRGAR